MSIGSLIPQLAGLSYNPPNSRAPGLGGQNFTHCCLLALKDSLTVRPDGNLSYSTTSFVAPGVSLSSLETAIHGDEFPCGAAWNGDTAGAPVVQVPYHWCENRCPGWEISHSSVMQQWVGPLVQFIVPSLAFCTNVPRTHKLAIPEIVFKAHPRTIVGLMTYWIRLLGAVVLMTLDTVVWLAICFAFAGPMLLSAMYEYALDRKVLEFLAPNGEVPNIPPRMRAQLLLAVVVGNIRMATLENEEFGGESRHHSAVSTDLEGKIPIAPSRTMSRLVHNSVWKRVMVMVDEHEALKLACRANEAVVTLPTKLKALLNAQASFGSTVGAPVLFFLGSFVYTVLDSDNNLGDNDTAHALAFGLWWMVIPYLAIISCAMLASNSPSTLDGIVYDGGITAPKDEYAEGIWKQYLKKAKNYSGIGFMIRQIEGYNPVETAFEGRFRTVKLWKRGLNKREWVQEAIGEYIASSAYRRDNRIQPDDLRKSLTLNPQDCLYVFISALFAVLVPCVLAFLTSYNTPQAGLSCRSMTYLVYAISQVCEMALWTCAARLRIRYGTRWSETNPTVKRVCWWGQVFVGFFSIFAAVGGTSMQLLGVYRSCACKVPVRYWPRLNDPNAYIVLSDNTAEDIEAARRWWTVTGSTAVGIIGFVCALAWWHQRRLRKVFRDVAEKLDGDEVMNEPMMQRPRW
ncbi:uncharacterized protein GGS22DRAFT_1858 [Annulohypoxylon maeteangense]|uniref:uncharacterized protein n=1 Tax=Annulohypoxylon maeteangense TaxID=1927788 RepID=UPI00200806FD|nr:uncharacterized protein GGS22DRAFT_1858 [Annulohypoxylon maeteangense]KAI0889622.1 hypothetical protein GGS22DRAFT_1858 [Annulohypoxylon maeteangense]